MIDEERCAAKDEDAQEKEEIKGKDTRSLDLVGWKKAQDNSKRAAYETEGGDDPHPDITVRNLVRSFVVRSFVFQNNAREKHENIHDKIKLCCKDCENPKRATDIGHEDKNGCKKGDNETL